LLSLYQKRLDPFKITPKRLSSRRQRDVSSHPIEELNAKVLLQRFDLETHGWLRLLQTFRRLAQAELFRNRPEDHETEVFEACHSMIRTLTRSGLPEHRYKTGLTCTECQPWTAGDSAIANSMLISGGVNSIL
jgi:hypothetical protein